ncbi:tetratricopeptide repeat protein [Bartonella sp. TP]|uniref:tetratricopeptide repeat protein n=1 Tax=Bartonella sp. TP TaxID=3057550 RepID=UPI0025AF0D1C|nr:tetratricopeptide repeat protein [Bartonella sp. TP]WJW80212.1 tetratricopeptide repeat protein [Bartonella sp. TP]
MRNFAFIAAIFYIVLAALSPVVAVSHNYEGYGAYLSGDVALKQGDNTNAVVYLQRALKASPNNILIKQKLFLAYLFHGSVEKAILLNEQLPSAQQLPMSAILNIVAKFKKGDLKSISSLAENPEWSLVDNLAVLVLKAWALYGVGQVDAAVQILVQPTFTGKDSKKKLLSSTLTSEMPEKLRQLFRPFLFFHMALLMEAKNPKQAILYFKQALVNYKSSLEDINFYRILVINYVDLLQRQREYSAIKQLLAQANELYVDDLVLEQVAIRVHNKNFILDDIFAGYKKNGQGALCGVAIGLANISSFTNYLKLAGADRLYASFAYFLCSNNIAVKFQYAGLIAQEALKQHQDLYRQIKPQSVYYTASRLEEALLWKNLGKPKTALSLLWGLREQTAAAEQSFFLATYMLADIYSWVGNSKKAGDIIESFINNKQTRTNWSIYYQAGIIFSHLGKLDKAVRYFDMAVSLAPDNAELLNYYGYVLLQNNMQLPKALSLLLKANSLDKNNGYILDSLGWAYYLIADYSKSLIYLQKAVELCPFESEALEHLGDVYWKVGQKQRAVYEWRHAIDSTKDEADIEKLKVKLKQGLVASPI